LRWACGKQTNIYILNCVFFSCLTEEFFDILFFTNVSHFLFITQNLQRWNTIMPSISLICKVRVLNIIYVRWGCSKNGVQTVTSLFNFWHQLYLSIVVLYVFLVSSLFINCCIVCTFISQQKRN
jgi:hypothetical protein